MFSSLTTLAGDNIGREDLIAWIASGDTLPPPQAGKTLEAGDDAIMAFLPPGYANEYNFPGVRLEIQTTTQFEPHQTYVEASAAHNGTARLAADGREGLQALPRKETTAMAIVMTSAQTVDWHQIP